MAEIKVAVKAIICKEDKILILKRSKDEDVFEDLWDIPGGRIEFGENPNEALSREVFEETQLNIFIKKPFNLWTFMASENVQVFGITIIADYVSGEVVLSKEHTEFKWIDPLDFKLYEAHKNLKKEILKYAQEE